MDSDYIVIGGHGPLNLNEPEEARSVFADILKSMENNSEPSSKNVAVWFKALGNAFIDAIAASKEKHMTIGEQITAFVNVVSQLTSIITLQSANNDEELKRNTVTIAVEFMKIYTDTIEHSSGVRGISFSSFQQQRHMAAHCEQPSFGFLSGPKHKHEIN